MREKMNARYWESNRRPRSKETRPGGVSVPLSARRCLRYALGTLILLGTLGLLAGCGYVYRTTIEGFIEDPDGAGINDATVRVYEEEPDEPDQDSPGPIVRTQTATSGGNLGYYSTTVLWEERFGDYGTEADRRDFYLGVTHDDFEGKIAKIPDIVSDQTNRVSSVVLTDPDAPEEGDYGTIVRTRVVRDDDPDEGVPGVRITIKAGEDDGNGLMEDEYRERTGDDGFVNIGIEWNDDEPDPDEGEESEITIEVEADTSDTDFEFADAENGTQIRTRADVEVTSDQAVNRIGDFYVERENGD